jgi:hypothetical protein
MHPLAHGIIVIGAILPASARNLHGLQAKLSQASAERASDASMIRGWFQAVWPDLGSFRAWRSATKVGCDVAWNGRNRQR